MTETPKIWRCVRRRLSGPDVTRIERYFRSGESGRSAGRLLTGRPKSSVSLRNVLRQHGQARLQGWRESGKCWKRRRPRTLRVRAGRIGMSMLMMAGVFMPRVTVSAMIVARRVQHCAGRIRVAKHDFESAVDGLEHEARGNERAQHQHRQHKRRGPVGNTDISTHSATPGAAHSVAAASARADACAAACAAAQFAYEPMRFEPHTATTMPQPRAPSKRD